MNDVVPTPAVDLALVFPPATDPRAPHLAIPALLAAARGAGHTAMAIDADLGGVLHLASGPQLADAARRLDRTTLPLDPQLRDTVTRLRARADALVTTIDDAVATLRDPVAFYDPHRLVAARNAVYDALEVHCAAAPRPLSYGLYPIRYDVRGVDPQKLRSLLDATADPATNLFQGYWEDHVFGQLARATPKVVGISILNGQQLLPGLTLARQLKARGHFVVIGGTVLTKFVPALQRRREFFDAFCDAVVVYEGETALLGLLDARASHGRLEGLPNTLWSDGTRVHMGPVHVENVTKLPTPDFDGLPLDEYLAPERVLPILLGKGCYFNRCKFCDIPFINHVSKRAYRVRGVERVAQDVRELSERFATRHFELTDEALPPRLLDGLADALGDTDNTFVGYARLEPGFTPELCRKLARMGMRKLFFGLESAAQPMLDAMDKGVRTEDIRPVLEGCRDAGIAFHLFSIVGLPGETEALARETLRFFVDNADVIDSPANTFDVHPFSLDLRTGYAEHPAAHGLTIAPSSLVHDFAVGVPDGDWHDAAGMSRERVAELIAEFWATLRATFRRFHGCPKHMVPMWEEYALLYVEHYRTRHYGFRTALAEDGRERAALRWAADVVRVPLADGRIRLLSRNGRVEVDAAFDELLQRGELCDGVSLLRRLAALAGGATPRAASGLLDRLLVAGLATLDVQPAAAEAIGA